MTAGLAAVPDLDRRAEHDGRSVPPALTVERLRPHFPALGITRLARQTGLDRIGIPCFSAIRPAAATLSVTQGKGIDDASAMASAIMEAVEYAVAESPACPARTATAAELQAAGAETFDPRRLLPRSVPLPAALPVRWVQGKAWPSERAVWLPLEALTLGDDVRDLQALSRSSNGLAAGNTTEEALFHAICELVERDATALWSLLPDDGKQRTEFMLEEVEDRALSEMVERVVGAGFELRLFDQTTDLGVPCAMAVIRDVQSNDARRFSIAAGYGCHPVGTRAIARAIAEAAQTRVTNIAGARDDFLPDEYFERLDTTTAFLAREYAGGAVAPSWLPLGTPLPELARQLAGRVGAVAGIAWAELGGADFGISVVRALSQVLEDRDVNVHWRPGRRALGALTGR